MDTQIIGPLKIKKSTDIISRYIFDEEDIQTGEIQKVACYLDYPDDSNYMLIPRYGMGHNLYKKNSLLSDGEDINIESNITLRNKIQYDAVKYIEDNNECLIQLAPGKGKTIIAIEAICRIKKKTIIFVDQTNLLNQWVDRILTFTNLTKEDIGIASEKDGFDKPVVIAMIRYVANRVEQDFNGVREKLKCFGLAIFDEVHAIIGPKKSSIPIYAITSKRIVSLTATPHRTDGKHRLIFEWFNYQVFKEAEYDIIPIIKPYYIDSKLSYKEKEYIMNNAYYTPDPKDPDKKILSFKSYFNINKYIKKFIERKNIFEQLRDIILNISANKNNNILVTCMYINALQVLYNYLDSYNLDIGLYTDSSGKISQKMIHDNNWNLYESERNLDKQIILSSYNMVNKGIDKPSWNCLIMLSPISAKSPMLEQTIGRICRKNINKDKALVIDIVDVSLPACVGMFKARQKFYKEKQFTLLEKESK